MSLTSLKRLFREGTLFSGLFDRNTFKINYKTILLYFFIFCKK